MTHKLTKILTDLEQGNGVLPFVSGSTSDEPVNCKKEYVEGVCEGCEFREYEMVGHPGGCSYISVEKAKCGWGHWEDDF